MDNTYLPPSDAANSGGNGLAPPNQSNGNGFNGNGNNGNGNNGNFVPQNGNGGFQPQESQQNSQSQQPPIGIVSYENENNGDGSYKWSYETENGNAQYYWNYKIIN